MTISPRQDLHNKLARKFVHDILGPAVKGGMTYAELLVLLETMEVAVLQMLVYAYGQSPAIATELAESTLNQAISRFAGTQNQKARP